MTIVHFFSTFAALILFQAGFVGSKEALLDWTDSKETALREVVLLGLESKSRIEVLTGCPI